MGNGRGRLAVIACLQAGLAICKSASRRSATSRPASQRARRPHDLQASEQVTSTSEQVTSRPASRRPHDQRASEQPCLRPTSSPACDLRAT
ncbi:UNVERIFIED_CONTAM: hypothetical protein Slati_2237000 [Sesamum latifolium]|uniref:Secreted protein n=1 Tax=Sesamum latifolium TaxID=2727402 RepID=A0AAW2WUR2_9LAMI